MIRRIQHLSGAKDGERTAAAQRKPFSTGDCRQKLTEALGEGVQALRDPEIEKRVIAYFEENPHYSRDAAHVAAIACRFKKEQIASRHSAENRLPVVKNRLC